MRLNKFKKHAIIAHLSSSLHLLVIKLHFSNMIPVLKSCKSDSQKIEVKLFLSFVLYFSVKVEKLNKELI